MGVYMLSNSLNRRSPQLFAGDVPINANSGGVIVHKRLQGVPAVRAQPPVARCSLTSCRFKPLLTFCIPRVCHVSSHVHVHPTRRCPIARTPRMPLRF